MQKQLRTLLLAAIAVTLVSILSACGGTMGSGGGETTASEGNPYHVSASAASLRDAGWKVTENAEDVPEPYTNVRLVGYLETSAPDGEPIDLEFYESPENAQGELPEAQKEDAPGATTVGNVLVYDDNNDTGLVSPENLAALQTTLK